MCVQSLSAIKRLSPTYLRSIHEQDSCQKYISSVFASRTDENEVRHFDCDALPSMDARMNSGEEAPSCVVQQPSRRVIYCKAVRTVQDMLQCLRHTILPCSAYMNTVSGKWFKHAASHGGACG